MYTYTILIFFYKVPFSILYRLNLAVQKIYLKILVTSNNNQHLICSQFYGLEIWSHLDSFNAELTQISHGTIVDWWVTNLVGLGSLSWDSVSLSYVVSSPRLTRILQMVVELFPGVFGGKIPMYKGFQSLYLHHIYY